MEEKRNLRKERIGVVSSNKGDKTITVTVKWKEKHPIYGKFVNKTKKYHAHDENNECSVGDTVMAYMVALARMVLLHSGTTLSRTAKSAFAVDRSPR